MGNLLNIAKTGTSILYKEEHLSALIDEAIHKLAYLVEGKHALIALAIAGKRSYRGNASIEFPHGIVGGVDEDQIAVFYVFEQYMAFEFLAIAFAERVTACGDTAYTALIVFPWQFDGVANQGTVVLYVAIGTVGL